MELHLLSGREKEGYTAFGSYWEKGEIKQAFFTLTNEKGEAVPLQSEAAAWWPDRSIKWCTHTADAVKMGETVRLEPAAEPVWERQNEKIRISRTEEGYQADTGAVSLFIPHAPSEFMERGGIRN